MSAGLLILRGDGGWAQDTKPGGARPPPDPEEELKYMAQEVRFYVEAVLGHLSGNIPKVGGHFSDGGMGANLVPLTPLISCIRRQFCTFPEY